jgi:hypothetical protein
MRVNSPGPGPDVDAAGGTAGACAVAGAKGVAGAADGNGTGSAANSEGAAGAFRIGAGGAGAGVASGFFPSAASNSSSSREGELGTVPKMPVALDAGPGGDPPPGSSDWGDCGLPKRSLNAFMRVPICAKILRCSGIQDYIDLA